MLTTGGVITAATRYLVNPGSDSYLYDEALRSRGLHLLRELGAEVHTLAPHWWKLADGTIALTSGDGFGTVPADFSSFGEYGQVYIQGQKTPLQYMAPDALSALVELEGASASTPQFYTLHNRTAAGRPKVYVYPVNSAAVTLSLRNYRKRVPDFIDLPMTAPTAAVNVAAGALSGTYTFKVTYVMATGETEGGAASNSVTPFVQKVNLTGIPVSLSPLVTARKVYRTVASGTDYLLAATIADNVTTVLTAHEVADVDLGAAMPTVLTATGTGMEQFPEDFHELVFVTGLAARLTPNATFDWVKWEKKARRIWNDQQQGQNVVHVMPRYGQGGGGGFNRSRLRSIIGG